MEKITSFTVSHLNLEPDVYVSRRDAAGLKTVTTFDLRITAPNKGPVMNTVGVHTLEHLGATFLRNHADFSARVLYFDPMGCRTSFYLLLRDDYEPADILPLLRELLRFITNFTGEVPGVAARDYGNYLDMNLSMTKWETRRYLERALNTPRPSQLHYPDREKLKL